MYRMQDIIATLKEQPFRPFRMHVSDGAHYDINHPEFVMVTTNKVLVFVPFPNQAFPAFQKFDSIAMLHITRLEPLETKVAASNN